MERSAAFAALSGTGILVAISFCPSLPAPRRWILPDAIRKMILRRSIKC